MKIRADMNVIGEEGLMAAGNVFLDELIVIHDVRVITKKDDEGKDIYYVVMPSRKKGDSWEKIVRIKDKDLYKEIDKTVMEAVNHAVMKDLNLYDLKVEIRPYEKGDTRAYATITLNDAVQIDNVRIAQSEDKLKVYYPFEKRDGVAQNLAGPATLHMKRMLDGDIIQAYEMKMKSLEKGKDIPAGASDNNERSGEEMPDETKTEHKNKKEKEVSR